MRITPVQGQPFSLPLDTSFVLDFSLVFGDNLPVLFGIALLDEEGTDITDEADIRVQPAENGPAFLFTPGETWAGLTPVVEGARAGTLVLYTSTGDFSFVLSGTTDPRATMITGSPGNDRLTLAPDATDTDALQAYNGDGGDDRALSGGGPVLLLGGAGNDTLVGGAQADALEGGADDDALYGGDGEDRLLGETGEDRLFGGRGHDLLSGGAGNDMLNGGAGNDILHGGIGSDTLRGESGDDRFVLALATPTLLGDGIASTVMYGGSGDDVFTNGNFVDAYDPLSPPTQGHATIHGGAGRDALDINSLEGGKIYGGADADLLVSGVREGSADLLEIFGGEGNDTLTATGGHVDIRGGIGEDFIIVQSRGIGRGEQGNDLLYVVSESSPGADPTGGTLFGGAGNDTLYGASQDDTLHGGEGHDTIEGMAGNDLLYGGTGDDTLTGGFGDDLYDGGTGTNLLVGGNGQDRFVFGPNLGDNTIQSFERGQDTLRFDAARLGIGDGDANVDTTADVVDVFSSWDSSQEIVFLRGPLPSLSRSEVATTLNESYNGETLGDVSLIVASDGTHTAIFRHVADGGAGVRVDDLTRVAYLENTPTLDTGDFVFF